MDATVAAAEVLGGLGMFVLGTWLATSGLGIALGEVLHRGIVRWRESALGAFFGGLAIAVLLGGNGALPASVAGLARRMGLRSGRGAALLLGVSFGVVAVASLVLVADASVGAAIAGSLLLAAAGAALLLPGVRNAWGESAAGLGLCLLGLVLLARGWGALGDGALAPGVWGNPLLVPVYAALGAGLGIGLRSPGAAAALLVAAAAGGALDGQSGAAFLVGVLASAGWCTLQVARAGAPEDRPLAAVHATFALASASVGGLLVGWSYSAPALLGDPPGGPALGLTVFLLVATGTAAVLTWAFLGPLRSVYEERLTAAGEDARAGDEAGVGIATVPALALATLAGTVDEAAQLARHLARRVLSGEGATEQRWRQAQVCVVRACGEVAAFRRGLEHVRWPAAAVESALRADACVRTWRDVLHTLTRFRGGRAPASDRELELHVVQARFAVQQLVDGTNQRGAGASIEELEARRGRVEAGLAELRSRAVALCSSGGASVGWLEATVHELSVLSELGRLGVEAQAARAGLGCRGPSGGRPARVAAEEPPAEQPEPAGLAPGAGDGQAGGIAHQARAH